MAMKYLGVSFDLHGGGEDLIFPHHECEIAQAEACTGKPFARYWVHNGMVNMGKEKMSKSLGNTLSIREIVKRHSPDTLRLWMLGTHYRNMIEWSEERVEESKRALERLTRLLHDAAAVRDGGAPAALPPAFAEFRPRFEKAMDDDFNTPQALGVLFDFGRALADARDRGTGTPGAFVAGVDELVQLSRVLGLFGHGAAMDGPPAEVQQLLTARGEARARRDFKRGDEIRDEIARLGWLVEDTPAGPRLTPKGR
jgi:cysteinyl-tRNA synthetase